MADGDFFAFFQQAVADVFFGGGRRCYLAGASSMILSAKKQIRLRRPGS